MTSDLLRYFSWSVCAVTSHTSLSSSTTTSGLCLYHFSFTFIPYFLHIFRWIFVPNQSCRLLYSFWANLLHSLNTWLAFFSAFPHILHLLFSWVFLGFSCFLSTLFLGILTNLHLLYPLFAWWIVHVNCPCPCPFHVHVIVSLCFHFILFPLLVLIWCFSIFIFFYCMWSNQQLLFRVFYIIS